MTLRIIIADDHPVVRIGTKAVIESSGVGQVVAEASTVAELMTALGDHECDVLVTDYSMPGGAQADGFAMIAMIRRRFPELPVLMLSVSNNLAILRMVVATGVLGLVDKTSSMDELPLAIQTVQRGMSYVSLSLKERIDAIGTESVEEGEARPLSPREVEVLRLLGSGMTVKEIAIHLHKSVSTISRQKGDAMLKLGLKGDAELFDYLRDGER
ncbi:response regulator transcription factor [Stenotrophomonas sp. TWI273]|jgi:two-component system capsular synthesis response regulator RcsB|uniref:response regulator transcription factor n=1 Tax=unclassified Stenotrophomonas TaxID=196198 RepID=UPI000E9717DD|nr:response regulator transcription factor [Stenotrophomonas sp.]HAU81608.1 DNA-binding response regulator [Stenotrophomonas sp.]